MNKILIKTVFSKNQDFLFYIYTFFILCKFFPFAIIFLVFFQSLFIFFRHILISVSSIFSFSIFSLLDNYLHLFFAYSCNLLLDLIVSLYFFDNKQFCYLSFIIRNHFFNNLLFHLNQNFSLHLLHHLCSCTKNEPCNHFLYQKQQQHY